MHVYLPMKMLTRVNTSYNVATPTPGSKTPWPYPSIHLIHSFYQQIFYKSVLVLKSIQYTPTKKGSSAQAVTQAIRQYSDPVIKTDMYYDYVISDTFN